MPAYFEFEVSLCDVEPKIWRQFLIRSTATFQDLHEAIQDACGWGHEHLFLFHTEDDAVIAGAPDDHERDPDAGSVKLSAHFEERRAGSCLYVYDFGDHWLHYIKLVREVDLTERFDRQLVAGARAFPPEDCGSLPGYEECVEVATGRRRDPERKEWMGDWHPERFDLNQRQRIFNRPPAQDRAPRKKSAREAPPTGS